MDKNIALLYFLLTLLISSATAQSTINSKLDLSKSLLGYPTENWEQAKQIVIKDAAWKTWIASREKAMQSWMSGQPDRSDWIAGTQQDWFSTATGAHLSWQPSDPIPADDPTAATTRTRRGAWVSFRRAYNTDRIQEAARLYRLSGNPQLRDWAAAQLDFYATNYQRWPLQNWNGRARMMGQALDEATNCTALLDAVRLIREAVPDERLESWRQKLFVPMAENLRLSYQGNNNISLWTRVAMAQIALEFEDQVLLSNALEGEQGIRQLLARNVSAEGFWKEGSFSYQAYVVRAMTQLLTTTGLKQRSELLQKESELTGKMLLSPLALRFPDGSVPAMGDARVGTPAIDRGLFEHVRRVLPTPWGNVEASLRKSWDALLDPPPAPASQISVPAVEPLHFPSLRAALLKDKNWQVFLHYGQATGFHAQAEALNIDVTYAGQYLFRDPGTVAYGSDLHQNFFRTPAAHSVAVIDGVGQEAWAPGQLISFSGNAVAASQPKYNSLASSKRRLTIANDTLTDELSLRSNDQKIHRLGFIVTTPCAVELSSSATSEDAATTALPSGPGFSYWQTIAAWNSKKTWNAVFQCREQAFDVEFSLPGAHRTVTAIIPDSLSPNKRTALYLEIDGRETTLTTRIKPSTVSH